MRWVLLLFALSSVAAAGTIEDTIPDARYLDYGQTYGEHTCRIVGVESTGQAAAASCVLIAPHWAITAAHVVGDMISCEVRTNAGVHRVTQIFPHQEWTGEYAQHDIALVHVAEPFRPAKYPPLSDGGERLGVVCAAAGYGMTGTLAGGLRGSDAALRAGTQRLYGSERSVWVCKIERRGTPLPLCIAPGDSGGGLWAAGPDGRTVLIGVNSCVTRYGGGKPRHVAGEESCHTRIDLYREWIRSIVGELDGECTLASCQKQP